MSKDPVRCSRTEFLEVQLCELLGLADASLEANQPSAAVAAKGKAIEVRAELDKLRAYEEDSKAQRSPLQEVRAMRQRADASGSHVAALALLRVELDLLEKEEARKRAEEEERLSHMTEEQKLALLVEALSSLPPDLREQVHDMVFSPVH